MSRERRPKIVIRACGDKSLELEEEVANQSLILKDAIERAKALADYCGSDIPAIVAGSIPDISMEILEKVEEYCKFHAKEVPMRQEAIDAANSFDAEFVKVDPPTLFGLIQAAYDLNIKTLMDLTCRTLADKIENKTPDEIEMTFALADEKRTMEEEDKEKKATTSRKAY